MFPQKGAVVPRLRFRGFSGEWEEICFNDIFKEKNHMHVESIDYPLMSFVQKLGVIPKVIDMTGKLWLKIWIKNIR
ncbi:hypothetical protein [Apilactobacillus ozensis]|uniref:hypothetical protein n=1 Tax=Apilactobacillus ozensis TaxID=866801 RepID=UPI0006CFFF48|nr:hypothetical protein [Apilactobacillus ozensis]